MSAPIGNGGFGLAAPAIDSTANNSVADVVGNKSDTHNGDSLYAKAETVEDHIHSVSKVYPTLADGVTLTCVNDASTWTLGSLVEVIPASTIASDFDVHHLMVESISANNVYEIVLYAGASDTEIGRVRCVKNAVQSGTLNLPMQTPIIAANSRIRAAVASATNDGETIAISLKYHTY